MMCDGWPPCCGRRNCRVGPKPRHLIACRAPSLRWISPSYHIYRIWCCQTHHLPQLREKLPNQKRVLKGNVASICFLQSLEKKKTQPLRQPLRQSPRFLQTTPQASNQKKRTQHPLTTPRNWLTGSSSVDRPRFCRCCSACWRHWKVAVAMPAGRPRNGASPSWRPPGGSLPCRVRMKMMKILAVIFGVDFLFKMYIIKRDDTRIIRIL